MRVLVTGGAGYIGSVIVEELTKSGHDPVVYDTFVKGHADALDPAVPVVRADLAEHKRLRETMEQHTIEAVIHMAGLIEVGLSVAHPEAFFDVNVAGSINVVRAMVETGVKQLVFSSTAALYGDPDRLPITEDEPAKPTNPYGESKLMVETMLAWAAPAHGITATALRYFNAAGATARNGEDHEPETHLIPLVLRAAEQGTPVSVLGTDYPTPDGTGVRDYIHVVDLARAHLAALARQEAGLRIYNVGTGEGHSVREVIDTARAVSGRSLEVRELPRRDGDQAATVASPERIRRELGWQPEHADLGEIIESAWRWRQTHPQGYTR
jgi:UDP-glucose 4-epimerase